MFKIVVAILYMFVMLLIGWLQSRKVKTAKDYAVAGDGVPMWQNMRSMASAGIGAGATMGVASMTWAFGISGCVLAVGAILGIIFSGIFFASKIRKAGVTTIPELVELKLGKKVAKAMSALTVFALFAALAGQIKSLGTILMVFIPSLNIVSACLIMTGVMVVYAALGGMIGAVKTDTINIVIMILSVVVILPNLILNSVGGFGGLVKSIAEIKPAALAPTTMGVLTMISTFLYIFATNMVNAEGFLKICSAKNEKEAKVALIGSQVLLGAPYMANCVLIGLAGIVLLPNLAGRDAIIPSMLDTLTTPLIGAFALAALLAAVMGTAASLFIAIGVTFTNNIVRPLKPEFSDKAALATTRVSGIVFTALGLVFAIFGSDIISIMQNISAPVTSAMFPIFIGMFYWKKLTPKAAMLTIIVAVASTCGWWIFGAVAQGASSGAFGVHHIIVGTVCATLTMLIAGLATYGKESAKA